MAEQLAVALSKVEMAASIVFETDSSVRSLGVGRAGHGFGFVVVRNVRAPVPFAMLAGGGVSPQIPAEIEGFPVHVIDSSNDPSTLARVPLSSLAGPGVGSVVPEQQFQRPLVCGLQIQNFDVDVRIGDINKGFIVLGTLGCFVRRANGDAASLSNNHVVAGQNAGQIGDTILQSGSATPNAAMLAGTLSGFVALRPSAPGASVATNNVVFNEVDAGVATLPPNLQYVQTYLPSRVTPPPRGVATAGVDDLVHKVGRTTGLTFGKVTQVGVVVGPMSYTPGPCWFRQSLVIEGLNGSTFSDHGDSGSAIIREDGMLVGLLFAGNGIQTYACTADNVLNQMACTLI
jgi:hypothetical protein